MTIRVFKGQWDAVAFASVILLAFSVLLGGASREHLLRLTVVELAALPVLVMAATRLIRDGSWRDHRLVLALAGAVILIPIAQLLPLPPAVWTALPGREQMVLALELAGLEPGWVPLSVTPALTWQSLLALVPPVAVLLAALGASHTTRVRMIGVFLVAAIAGVVLGTAQLASGNESLYPWETTSAGSVTGFFANRNHLATLLLSTLPFAAVIGGAVLRHSGRDSRLPLWFAALFMGLVVVGLAAIRSRAGVILFGPVTILSLLAAWVAAGRGRIGPQLIALGGTMAAAVAVVAVFALPPIMARFDTQSAPEGRFEAWPIVTEAASAYLPVGSGIGSFDAVFRSVEPVEDLDSTFFNHAHNEYLEVWLEAGWLGAALIMAILVWYGRRLIAAWAAPPSRERDLQRAASIALLVMLAHSAFDYPLRTLTLACVFALCAAILDGAGQPDRREAA